MRRDNWYPTIPNFCLMSKMLMISQRSFGVVLYLRLRSMNLKVLTSYQQCERVHLRHHEKYIGRVCCKLFLAEIFTFMCMPIVRSLVTSVFWSSLQQLFTHIQSCYLYYLYTHVQHMHHRGTQWEVVKNVVWTYKHTQARFMESVHTAATQAINTKAKGKGGR